MSGGRHGRFPDGFPCCSGPFLRDPVAARASGHPSGRSISKGMIEAFSAVVPVFLLIGLGVCLDLFRALPENANQTLSLYVLNVALPLLLFQIMATAPLESFAHPRFWLGVIAAQFLIYGACYAADRILARHNSATATVTALGGCFCNAAFVGIPVITSALPGNAEALFVAGLFTITPNLLFVVGQVQLAAHDPSRSMPQGRKAVLLHVRDHARLALDAVNGRVAAMQRHEKPAVAVGSRGDLEMREEKEVRNLEGAGENDVAVVVDAGERALAEEDDLVRRETEVVVLLIEWVKETSEFHRISKQQIELRMLSRSCRIVPITNYYIVISLQEQTIRITSNARSALWQ